MDCNQLTALTAFKSLYNNSLFSDIVFTFDTSSATGNKQDQAEKSKYEGVVVYGHKNILAARSEYFSTMFQTDPNGQFVTNNGTCNITDIEPDIFEMVMKYIYSDMWETEHLTVDMALAILYAAKQYMLDGLVTNCVTFLNEKMSPDNIHLFLTCFNLLTEDCIAKLDAMIQIKTVELLQNPSFMELQDTGLCYILQNDNLTINEIDLFNALLVWARESCKKQNLVASGKNIRQVLGPALALIRFPVMTSTDFTQKVVPEEILTVDEEVWVHRTIGNGGNPLSLSNEDGVVSKFDLKKRGPVICTHCGQNSANSGCILRTRYCKRYGNY